MRIFLTACLLFASPLIARADSWALPTPVTTVSNNGDYRLTIYPRQLNGQLEYFSDKVDGSEPAGQVAGVKDTCEATLEKFNGRAYELVWRKPMVNEVAPVTALVGPEGRFVTFDNWHSMGYGPDVVVIYNSEGVVVRQYGLEQLIAEEEFAALPRTVSSIHWSGTHSISYDGVLHLQVANTRTPEAGDASGTDEAPVGYKTIRISMENGKIVAPD